MEENFLEMALGLRQTSHSSGTLGGASSPLSFFVAVGANFFNAPFYNNAACRERVQGEGINQHFPIYTNTFL